MSYTLDGHTILHDGQPVATVLVGTPLEQAGLLVDAANGFDRDEQLLDGIRDLIAARNQQ